MSQVQTALSNTTLSGYVDTAAQWNLGSPKWRLRPGASTGYRPDRCNKADGFNLNAIDIALDKPQDESPGLPVIMSKSMAGPDASYATARNTGNGSCAIRQAYLALRTPMGNSAIDWKVGVFDTIIGYESTSDPANPNYTRSYGYSIEPTTQTGILGTFKVNDMIHGSGGRG